MINKIKYEFSALTWQHASPGGWYFVSLPKDMSTEIEAISNGKKKVGED